MMFHLQSYDSHLLYHPECEMVPADALSCYHSHPEPDIELDITINHMQLCTECMTVMQNVTATNPKLSALAQMIIDGWPELLLP